MFGLNCILICIISRIYHLFVSDLKSFLFLTSVVDEFFFIRIYEECPRSSHRSKDILKNLNVHISGSTLSQRSMFGLNCILIYIMSHIYHLFVSDLKSFLFMTSVDHENLSYAYMGPMPQEFSQKQRDIEKSKCPYLRFYLELEVDVWLELHLKIYYESCIPFVCERKENFLNLKVHFMLICDF